MWVSFGCWQGSWAASRKVLRCIDSPFILETKALRILIEITFLSLFEGVSKNWGLYQAERGTSVDGTFAPFAKVVPFFCDLGRFVLVRSLSGDGGIDFLFRKQDFDG